MTNLLHSHHNAVNKLYLQNTFVCRGKRLRSMKSFIKYFVNTMSRKRNNSQAKHELYTCVDQCNFKN